MTTRARLNRGTWLAIFGVLAFGLMMPVAAATPAPAFHQPNPNNPPQVWAWGATFVKNGQGTLSGNGSGPGGTSSWSLTYTIHAFLSWNVILTQTNTSTTSFSLQGQRVMAASYFLSASGSNGPESGQLNVTAQGWETDNGFANFTTTGTVLLNGTTPVAALAVENANGNTAGNFTAISTAQLSGPQSGSFSGYASAAAEAQASLAFQPPLGLFPLNVTSGAWWTSTSNYTAQGTYSVACHYGYSASGAGGTSGAGGNCGSSGSASGSGSVTVYGADHDLDTGFPGQTFHKVTLGFSAGFQFELRDGLLFVPSQANLYASATGPAGGSTGAPTDGAQVSLNYLDVSAHATHAPVVATNAQFSPRVGATMGVGLLAPSGSFGALASPSAVSAPAGLSAYAVQAQPESPSQAQSNNACLLSGCAAAGKSGIFSPLVALLVVGAAVAVVVGAVMVERSRRPKMPVGGYSSRPPAAFLLHNGQGTNAPAGSPTSPSPRPAGRQVPAEYQY